MSQHVVIIGAGVIGLSTAYYCARRGLRVTVIERNGAEREGCSFGNAGMIVPSHFTPLAAPGMVALGLKWMWHPESPFYIKPQLSAELLSWAWNFWRASTKAHVERCAPLLRDLSFASREYFEELAALPGADFGFTKRGLLMLCRTQHALDDEEKVAATANALGVPAEVLNAKQTSALDPGVRLDVAGSVYFPKDCHFSPGRFMTLLQAQGAALGVKFEWNTEVTGLEKCGNHIQSAITSHGETAGDEYVLCGGSWSPMVAQELGLKIPLQAGKGYSLTLLSPKVLPQICSILCEARVAVTPMNGSLRVGGTMEIAGLNEKISPGRVRGIVQALPRYYPDFSADDFTGIEPWVGLRPCSPDGMPYLGRTKKYSNLTLATGHAMMGLSLGPITGKIVSDIIAGDPPGFDLAPLNPDRYA